MIRQPFKKYNKKKNVQIKLYQLAQIVKLSTNSKIDKEAQNMLLNELLEEIELSKRDMNIISNYIKKRYEHLKKELTREYDEQEKYNNIALKSINYCCSTCYNRNIELKYKCDCGNSNISFRSLPKVEDMSIEKFQNLACERPYCSRCQKYTFNFNVIITCQQNHFIDTIHSNTLMDKKASELFDYLKSLNNVI